MGGLYLIHFNIYYFIILILYDLQCKLFMAYFATSTTVLTFNPCTKCVGSPVILHDRKPD